MTQPNCEPLQYPSADKNHIIAGYLYTLPGAAPRAVIQISHGMCEYITTPAITALIEAGCFASITVMIQREVARRICAAPGTPDYGAFSVFCQYHTRPELLFDVPPECFLPAPKVTSSVLRMVPCPPP